MLTGHATPEGTAAHAAAQVGVSPDFFAVEAGLTLSSLGFGTYLGASDAKTDRGYSDALERALALGVDHIDTAINYRAQASERGIGRTLERLAEAGTIRREALLVATKGGFIPRDRDAPERGGKALLAGIDEAEVVDGSHCLSARFIEGCLARSRENLRLHTLDVYYLHNPEAQLPRVPRAVFHERLRRAFAVLEAARGRGEVRWYGTATWSGYRLPVGDAGALELERIVECARSVGGAEHGLRFVQLPVNAAMPEAVVTPTQRVGGETLPAIAAIRRLGLVPVASGPLLQAKLLRDGGLPADAEAVDPAGVSLGPAQRALQLVRSSGVATALVGTSNPAHVDENLALRRLPRASAAQVGRALVLAHRPPAGTP